MTALKMPARVPPTIVVWRFSSAHERDSSGNVLEGVAMAGSWDAVEADVEEVGEAVEVDVVVEALVIVEVLNISVPRDFVLIFGMVALLQQLLVSSAARQQ